MAAGDRLMASGLVQPEEGVARAFHVLPSAHSMEVPVHVPSRALGPPLGLKSTRMVGRPAVFETTDARTVQGCPFSSTPVRTVWLCEGEIPGHLLDPRCSSIVTGLALLKIMVGFIDRAPIEH